MQQATDLIDFPTQFLGQADIDAAQRQLDAGTNPDLVAERLYGWEQSMRIEARAESMEAVANDDSDAFYGPSPSDHCRGDWYDEPRFPD